jgi:carboxymethylenebutenolidase
VDSFDKKVVAAGRNFTRVNYDAVHAFANPSNPDFDKTNAEDARAKALAFLKKTKG